MHRCKFKLSGLTFDIFHKSSEEMGGSIGLANFNDQTISINNTVTKQTKQIATWHEIIHIMDSVYGLNLTEEQVIHQAHAMVSFVNDNPHLIDDKGLGYE